MPRWKKERKLEYREKETNILHNNRYIDPPVILANAVDGQWTRGNMHGSFAANVCRRGWTLREIDFDRRKGIVHGWLKFVEGGGGTFTPRDFVYVHASRYRYLDERYRDRELCNQHREREFFRCVATRRVFPPDCLNL